jgi:hypothetical protein
MILLVIIVLVASVDMFAILPFKFVAERVNTFALEYTVRKLVDVAPENIVLPDKLEKFITDVVRSFVAALNAVMVHPDAVENTSDFTVRNVALPDQKLSDDILLFTVLILLPDKLEKFMESVVRSLVAALNAVMVHPDAVENTSDFTVIAFAVMVLTTFMEHRTFNDLPIVMFCDTFTNGALIVVDCTDSISTRPRPLYRVILSGPFSLIRFVLMVTVLLVSDVTDVMVEIASLDVGTSMTEFKSPIKDEMMVEISFTVLLVAKAPKLTGEYGDTRKGLLLFEAKLSADFCCFAAFALSFCIKISAIASTIFHFFIWRVRKENKEE